jgi:preprotein translocase subunit SecD
MYLLIFLALLATAGTSQADTPPDNCKFFAYPVNEKAQIEKPAVIRPSHISSIDFQGIDPYSGFRQWRITLNAEGTSVNAEYTKTHIGKKIALFCDSQEIARPTIVAQSSSVFVVVIPDKEP